MAVFSEASDNLHDRIQEARAIIEVVKRNESEKSHEEETKILKGLFFVVVYGAVEKSICDCITICINYLNTLTLKVTDIRPELWALAYNPDCTRIEQNSNKRKWGNRNELFSKLYANNEKPYISPVLYPLEMGNVKMKQISVVWQTFGIKAPENPDLAKGYDQTLKSIAEERMKIAHGRTTSTQVGSLVTAAEMQKKLNDVDYYCNYIISCFENYVTKRDYLV